ncbi:MAG: hypothetical protein HY716_03210 [Planctomycetes bacterium]|nr:hypothetical protein [Planctomycetota bacterium]
MREGCRSLLVILVFAVFAAPLCADVVPARRIVAEAEAAQVADRLASLGVAARTAAERVESLTAAEIEFFASAPRSVQVAGAEQDFFTGQSVNLWYESLGGAFMLATGIGAGFYMISNRE